MADTKKLHGELASLIKRTRTEAAALLAELKDKGVHTRAEVLGQISRLHDQIELSEDRIENRDDPPSIDDLQEMKTDLVETWEDLQAAAGRALNDNRSEDEQGLY